MLPLIELSLLSTLTVPPSIENTKQPPIHAPEITTVLPADTPLVMFVNTKVENWKSLSSFQLFKTTFDTAAKLLPTTSEFNYEIISQLKLGDKLALVMMPQARARKVSIDSNFLMLASVQDDRQLKLLLNTIKADKQQQIKERQYKGITILEWQLSEPSLSAASKSLSSSNINPLNFIPAATNIKSSTDSIWKSKAITAAPTIPLPSKVIEPTPQQNQIKGKRSLAIALLPGFVAIAQTGKPIEQLIDTPKGSPTLAQNPNFQKTSQNPHFGKALFTLYQNPTEYFALIDSILKDPNLPFPAPPITAIKPEQLQAYSSIDGFLWVQPEGLHLQSNVYLRKPNTANTLNLDAEQILTRIPAPSYSTITGRNLQQQWQAIAAVFNASPQLKDGLAQFNNFTRSLTGLELERDILAWMDGEYAFFLYPTKQGLLNSFYDKLNLGVGFVVQTSDRIAAETTLKKLDASIKSVSGGEVAAISHSINGISATSWEAQQQSLLAYSWVDKKTLFVTTGLEPMKELLPQPRRLLIKDYNFTAATRLLPYPNRGYFYMNFGSSLSWAYNLLPADFNFPGFSTFKQAIGGIYSISATSSTNGDREQSDALIVLAPVRN